MDERIEKSLDKLLEYVESAEVFVVEQAPLVAQDILTRPLVDATYLVACVLGGGLVLAISFYRGAKCEWWSSEDSFEEYVVVITIICALFALVILAPLLLLETSEVLHAHFTPRLYLLERLRNML